MTAEAAPETQFGQYVQTIRFGWRGRVYKLHGSCPEGMEWFRAQGLPESKRLLPWASVLVHEGGSVCVPVDDLRLIAPFDFRNPYAQDHFPADYPIDETEVSVVDRTPGGVSVRYGRRQPVHFERSQGQALILAYDEGAAGRLACPHCHGKNPDDFGRVVLQEVVGQMHDQSEEAVVFDAAGHPVIGFIGDGDSSDDGGIDGVLAPLWCRSCGTPLEMPDNAAIEWV
jgi:hypothetical protein